METFVIWSHEHRMWWNPDRQGYTMNVHEAGEYTEREAFRIVINSIPWGIEVAVPTEIARSRGTDVVFRAEPWV